MATDLDADVQQEAVNAVDRLPDDQLIVTIKSLAAHERHATARLIAALAEMQRRRLYLGQGCSSLYAYCTDVLGISEDAAYNRVQAARAGLRFPILLRDLDSGALTVSTVRVLAPMLTAENHVELLAAARHRTKRQVEGLVASLSPAAVTVESSVTPVGDGTYLFHVAASKATYDTFLEAQALLRHAVPDGDIASVFGRAVDALVRELKRSRMAEAEQSRTARRSRLGSRSIPAPVKRAVWSRDGGRCAFIGPEGRCAQRAFLELHHVVPFIDGGPATAENIQLRCRAHNVYEAERWDQENVAENSSFRNGR